MPQITIPYSQLKIPQLVTIFNEVAIERGKPTLKAWHDSRCQLVQRLAILRTLKPLPPDPVWQIKVKTKSAPKKRRKQPIRDAILEALAFVSHYETPDGKFVSKARARSGHGTLLSVGLRYDDCLARVRKKFPRMSRSTIVFRVIATRVRDRETGYAHCKLPHKRPHGTKGRTK